MLQGDWTEDLTRKLSTGLHIVKQWTKQQIGHAEQSAETVEFQQRLHRFDVTCTIVRDVCMAVKSCVTKEDEAIEASEEMHLALQRAAANEVEALGVEEVLAGSARRRLGVCRARRRWVDNVREEMLEPLELVVATDIVEARESRRSYDIAHLAYDAQVARVEEVLAAGGDDAEGEDRLQVLEDERRRAKESFDLARSSLLTQMNKVGAKAALILAEHLQVLEEAEVRYHTECLQVLAG